MKLLLLINKDITWIWTSSESNREQKSFLIHFRFFFLLEMWICEKIFYPPISAKEVKVQCDLIRQYLESTRRKTETVSSLCVLGYSKSHIPIRTRFVSLNTQLSHSFEQSRVYIILFPSNTLPWRTFYLHRIRCFIYTIHIAMWITLDNWTNDVVIGIYNITNLRFADDSTLIASNTGVMAELLFLIWST